MEEVPQEFLCWGGRLVPSLLEVGRLGVKDFQLLGLGVQARQEVPATSSLKNPLTLGR